MSWASQLPSLFHNTSFDSQIDRLFEEASREFADWRSAWTPECNVYEDGTAFYVQIAVPGMDPGAIEVQIKENVLWVKGECKVEVGDDRTWYVQELSGGPFSCSFRLPGSVDASKSTASYKHGLLTITFPKYEEAMPRRIMIEGQ